MRLDHARTLRRSSPGQNNRHRLSMRNETLKVRSIKEQWIRRAGVKVGLVASACAAISSSAEKRDLCAVLTQRSQWWSKSQKCNTQSSAPPATVTVAVGTEQIAPTAPPSGSARADQLAQGADEALVAMRSSCRGLRVRPPPPRPPPRPRPPPLPFSLSRAKLSFSWADVDGQEAGRWPSLILAQRAGVACRVLNLPCRRCRTHGRQDQGM